MSQSTFSEVFSFHGKKFYVYLVSGERRNNYLLKDSGLTDQSFIIKLDGEVSGYTFFNTYADFWTWQDQFKPCNRNFFEVIRSGKQKPHFDIDITLNEKGVTDFSFTDELLQKVLDAIEKVFSDKKILYEHKNHLLVFSSHGPKKRSFHIVLDKIVHSNHKQAKQFYKLVKEQIPENFQPFIDGAVYSKLQNFRLLGSQKYQSGRTKDLCSLNCSYRPVDDDRWEANTMLRQFVLFEKSLVGVITRDDITLDLLDESVQPNRVFGSIDDTTADSLIAAFQKTEMADHFKIGENNNGVIPLTRISRCWCPAHNREHDHENAYLFTYNGKIYYGCHRDEGGKFCLDTLKNTTDSCDDSDLEDEPVVTPTQNPVEEVKKVQLIVQKIYSPYDEYYLSDFLNDIYDKTYESFDEMNKELKIMLFILF